MILHLEDGEGPFAHYPITVDAKFTCLDPTTMGFLFNSTVPYQRKQGRTDFRRITVKRNLLFFLPFRLQFILIFPTHP